MAKNRIVHVEWRTNDGAKLSHFYGELFNWKFKAEGEANQYTLVDTKNKELAGGIFQLPPGALMPPGFMNYIEVDDLEAYEKKVQTLGGKVMMSKQPVEKWGTFSVFADLDGNVVGLWESLKKKDKKKKKKKD